MQVALRPDADAAELMRELEAPRGKQSLSTFLRKAAHLSPPAIGLLQEAAIASGVSLAALSPASLAGLINAVPVRLNGIAPIARAISSAGGISFDELDADFMIRRLPGVFAAGEMLDWEAPTGGYLLQASFATGAAAGRGVLKWIGKKSARLPVQRRSCAVPTDDRRSECLVLACIRHAGLLRSVLAMTGRGRWPTSTSPVPPPAALP